MQRGLYLHIPFCDKKCIYCDFYSIENTSMIDAFVNALLREIDLRLNKLPEGQRTVDTVFFGGGTPSLLRPEQIGNILNNVREHLVLTPDVELTMECNPGTVTVESLSGYREHGVNRLSFGVQSFYEDDLKFLSRIHSRTEAFDALTTARAAGFDNVNLDLMFALPRQKRERWQANMKHALELGPEHISAYSLIFEEGTPLNAMRLRGEVREADEDLDAAMYDDVMQILADGGYEQYEVSNFARDGLRCRHNLKYWNGEEYFAVGPSAHGYLDETRYWNVRNLKRYMDMMNEGVLPLANSERLSRSDRMFERAFLGLRSTGIVPADFQREFDIDVVAALGDYAGQLQDRGLARFDGGVISLTAAGYMVCDAISAEVITRLEDAAGAEWTLAADESRK